MPSITRRIIVIVALAFTFAATATQAVVYYETKLEVEEGPSPVLVVEEDDWQWLEEWFTEEETARVVTNSIELDVFQYIIEQIKTNEEAVERLIAINGPYIIEQIKTNEEAAERLIAPNGPYTEKEPHAHDRASSVYVSDEVKRWRPLVERYFPIGWVDWGLRIIQCESGGDPTIKNRSSSASGLFQHLPMYWDGRSADAGWAGADIFDPEANAAVAAWLLETGGTSHWSCKAARK